MNLLFNPTPQLLKSHCFHNPPHQQGITDPDVGSLTSQVKKNTGNIMYAYMRNFKMGKVRSLSVFGWS